MIDRRAFMPHQSTVFQWAKNRREIGLFLEMRLGKSLVAIRWAKSRRPQLGPNLIVSPLSVIPNWSRELDHEGIVHEILWASGHREKREQLFAEAMERGVEWFIINWEGLVVPGGKQTKPTPLAKVQWGSVILDESPMAKSARSKRTKVVVTELVDAPYKAILSGLPNPEGPQDYVTQMIFLNGSFMGHSNFWSWRIEHMMPAYHGGWTVKHSSLEPMRRAVRESAYFLTRKQAGIGSVKLCETRSVFLPQKVQREIERARKEFEVAGRLTTNVLEALTWATQLAGGRYPHDETLHHNTKLSVLKDLVVDGEFSKQPIVVWARYTAEILACVEMLKKKKVRATAVWGETKNKQREIDRFMNGKTRVIVCQPKCFKYGTDFSIADVAVVYSNYWDFEVRSQITDRIIHPKKTTPVLIVDIIANNTPDEDLVMALTEKGATAQSFNANFMETLRRKKAA